MRIGLAVCGGLLTIFSGSVLAASHFLPEGSLICDSASLLEQQEDLVAKKDFRQIRGCGLSKEGMIVELVSTSLLGPTEVYVPSARVHIFIQREALN